MSEPGSERDLPSLLAAWRAIFSVAWRAWPAGALVTTVGWFFPTVLAGPLLGLALRRIVAGHGFADPVWIALVAIGIVTPDVILSLTDHVRAIVAYRTEQRVSAEIILAALRPHGIEHLENPLYADRVAFLRAEATQVAAVFGAVAGQAGLAVGFLLSLVVLTSLSPLLLLPVLGALLLGALPIHAAHWALAVREGATADQRLADHLVKMATSPAAAPDIRMLGLRDWLIDRYDRSTRAVVFRLLRSERRGVLAAALGGAMQALMLALGLALLVWLAARGKASAGDIVLGIVLLQTALENARGLASSSSIVVQISFAARRYLWLLRYTTLVQPPANALPAPRRLTRGIRFEAVSFRYPFTDRDVLQDISVLLPAGSVVAIVGDNGAGKSTLAKLLCRYYDPTVGRITVDGIDLRELDLDEWRDSTTAGFQDFARFEFTGEESIGASRVDILSGDQVESSVRRELIVDAARAGGADRFLEALPAGYDTQLGRQFGGVQLSDGQWQKVAMSRAFLRSAPLLTILDEPTAALDPRAEHELFVALAKQSAANRARGAITVLVSHRFSTVRAADQIIVLSGGRVAEVGDHETLTAADGLYRRLYESQAERYR